MSCAQYNVCVQLAPVSQIYTFVRNRLTANALAFRTRLITGGHGGSTAQATLNDSLCLQSRLQLCYFPTPLSIL